MRWWEKFMRCWKKSEKIFQKLEKKSSKILTFKKYLKISFHIPPQHLMERWQSTFAYIFKWYRFPIHMHRHSMTSCKLSNGFYFYYNRVEIFFDGNHLTLESLNSLKVQVYMLINITIIKDGIFLLLLKNMQMQRKKMLILMESI